MRLRPRQSHRDRAVRLREDDAVVCAAGLAPVALAGGGVDLRVAQAVAARGGGRGGGVAVPVGVARLRDEGGRGRLTSIARLPGEDDRDRAGGVDLPGGVAGPGATAAAVVAPAVGDGDGGVAVAVVPLAAAEGGAKRLYKKLVRC